MSDNTIFGNFCIWVFHKNCGQNCVVDMDVVCHWNAILWLSVDLLTLPQSVEGSVGSDVVAPVGVHSFDTCRNINFGCKIQQNEFCTSQIIRY